MLTMKNRVSPLVAAVLSGDLGAVSRLAQSADVNARDADGRTALHHAVLDGNREVVNALILAGADVNIADGRGWTALHFSAQDYKSEIASLLIGAGAQIDSQDEYGNTPLWRAVFASKGRAELIKVLLTAGADKHVANRNGVTPLKLAETIANFPVAPLLR